MGSATTESMTAPELDAELRRLEGQLGMSVDIAEHLAAADALDADLSRSFVVCVISGGSRASERARTRIPGFREEDLGRRLGFRR
jgi:hypothetical protein